MMVDIMLEGRFLVVWLFLTATSLGVALNGTQDQETEGGNKESCKFPAEWRDSYFLGGSRDPFSVDSENFGTEGFCYKNHGENKFTIVNRQDKCFRCLQVWARHRNAIQYKMSDCRSKKQHKKRACEISEADDFQTLVKLSGPDAECPFSGRFNFTYKKGGKDCANPTSHVVECMSDSQSLLKFEVCPDSVKEEDEGTVFYNTIIGLEGDTHETLTCKASWPNDLDKTEIYMMGTLDYRYKRTDEERVRCFLVKETQRGITIAQSRDATCSNELDSSLSGYRTMKLQRAETEEPKCQFPLWAQEMGKLHSFSFSSMYQFVEEGYVLSLSNYSTASKRSHELSRTICISVQEEDQNYIKMVTRVIANCDQMYKCLRILKRTENILEIQEGSPTSYEKAACTPQNFDDKLMIYTTLFKENLEKQPCPINGIHNVTDLDLDGQSETCEKNGFTNINIKCGDTHVIQFYKECPNEKRLNKLEITSSSVYHCLGGWEEQIPLREMPNPYARNGASFLANYYTGRGGQEGRRTNLFVADKDGSEEDLQNQQYYEANVTIGYVVAMRQRPPLSEEDELSEGRSGSEHPKRICFIYAVVNGSGVGSSYSWTVDKTACLRNIRPGHMARQRFNTTVLETCGSGRPPEQVRWLLLAVLWYSCNL